MAFVTRALRPNLVGLMTSSKHVSTYVEVLKEKHEVDHMTNITPTVLSLVGRNYHLLSYHPVCIVKEKMYDYFAQNCLDKRGNPLFATFDHMCPISTPAQSFDSCLIPAGHKDRSKRENVFINEQKLLRCHLTPDVIDLAKMGHRRILTSGDVFRFNQYDSTHNQLFHQTEILQLLNEDELFPSHNCAIFDENFRSSSSQTEERQLVHTVEAVAEVESFMRTRVEDLLFGEILGHNIEHRWVHRYLQFSRPDYDLEVRFNDEWLEVGSIGIMHQEILDKAGATDGINWNCAFGLDRVAMVLYDIPDIRLLSSKNEKLIASLSEKPGLFKSELVPSYLKEIVFFIPDDINHADFEYKFYEFLRIAGDVIEKAVLVDEYRDALTNRVKHRYLITYRNWESPLSKEEVNEHHSNIGKAATSNMKIELQQI